MLIPLLLILASAQPALAQQNEPPATPDWRYEFTVVPLRSSSTEEWTCDLRAEPSRISVRIGDVGRGSRNKHFKAELLQVRVEGRAAGSAVVARIKNALRDLNNISVFRGMCRHTAPALEIEGFEYDGQKYTKKSVTIDLR